METRQVKMIIPDEIISLLNIPDGTAKLKIRLCELYTPEEILGPHSQQQNLWEWIGQQLMAKQRYYEAIDIFTALYNHMLSAQKNSNEWTHKGMPLVWISDSFSKLGFIVHAKRYLMLTMCEDAIREKGKISGTSGVYNRLVWAGLPESELNDYAKQVYDIYLKDFPNGLYPEWILQKLNQNWITTAPSPQEAYFFKINEKYLEYLLSQLGDKSGMRLEGISEYLLSCMAGCRTNKRKITHSSDHDIIVSIEGLEMDFRSELGRYFIAECKDWIVPADFTTVAKFCRVLDSIKAKFGILFSKNGVSGNEDFKFGEREIIKVYQDRGIVIVVINESDILSIKEGGNFISLLRNKYDKIRLDLI